MNPLQNNALNDIVAVHGLRAIPNMTWKERISGMNWFSHETMLPNAASQALIPRFEYDWLQMGKNSYQDFAADKCVQAAAESQHE
jgi:hypothetical protein